jgi:hypothetical protein
MTTRQNNNAPTSAEVVDRYFLEHRAKLIDLAAFLDRIDRAGGASGAESDFRIAALFKAIDVLCDGRADRAGRILAIFFVKTDLITERCRPTNEINFLSNDLPIQIHRQHL